MRVAHDHCERCRTYAPEPPAERNQELEAFLARWATDNGYTLRWQHSARRSTARLDVAADRGGV